VSVDKTGRILVSDSGNNRVRQLFNGVVSTIAGAAPGYKDGPSHSAQFCYPHGLCVDDDGNIFVAD